MATNQNGIAITIKAWLPVQGTLEAQIDALTLVKTAHETGDYTALLNCSQIDEVKSEQKTRRVEAQEKPTNAEVENTAQGGISNSNAADDAGDHFGGDPADTVALSA